MRTLPALRSRRRMAGLSLIELMVSLTIGIILMIAIVSAYLGSASASRVAEAQGRMNEDASAALGIITQHLKMTGNNPFQPDYSPAQPTNPVFPAGSYSLRGCDGTFTNVTSATTIAALTCTNGTTADSIAIAYEADKYNTVKSAASKATDCLGQALPDVTSTVTAWDPTTSTLSPSVNATYNVADIRFYISTALGAPNLYCKGNGGAAAQPVVENIENLQVTYGVAKSTTTDTAVAGYLAAANIADAAGALSALPAEDDRWKKVLSVRVCVIARSESPVVSDADSAKYYDCTGTLVAAPDLRLRRAYSTTVLLRNRVSPA